ncbi:hypothetical protein DLAC_06655 [Tieghemostelium lacteum]|uniref:Uncharacterized protein n=1 Tax=Tieghemostelium lacteum TaxID=361077 RepID=A0A151ZFB3_TIELA|nr:hypothetical protein DLAC_06655 [Tieghemostelium lacteum]|eukprot:KYQ92661.1 hypothetical protein DLAC_06655 [Tieghemostelium lacteum]
MQVLKQIVAVSFANVSLIVIDKSEFILALVPDKYDSMPRDVVEGIYNRLSEDEKNKAAFVYWELSKKLDSRIDGINYGRDCFWNNLQLSIRSLHRCGYLLKYYDPSDDTLVSIKCCNTKASSIAQYYNLGEKIGYDYPSKHIGFINGMGNTIRWAGTDASKITNAMCDGVDLHCVYLPSIPKSKDNYSPTHSITGFIGEATRHLSVTGGIIDRTSCLLVQLWIDYLCDNPSNQFLQMAASDGGTFTQTALRILMEYRPDLCDRLNLLLLAPGTIILPNHLISPNQVINLIKKEDHLITKLGNGASNHLHGKHQNVIIVPHLTTSDHPHNFTNPDYMSIGRKYIENYKLTGRLL